MTRVGGPCPLPLAGVDVTSRAMRRRQRRSTRLLRFRMSPTPLQPACPAVVATMYD